MVYDLVQSLSCPTCIQGGGFADGAPSNAKLRAKARESRREADRLLRDKAKLVNAVVKLIQESEANARAQAGVPAAAAAAGSTLANGNEADSTFATRVATLLRVALAAPGGMTPLTQGTILTDTEVAHVIHALLAETDIDDDIATAATLDSMQGATNLSAGGDSDG